MKNRVTYSPNDYLEKIFWKAPNPMGITTAKEGIYIDVNEAFTKYFGLRRREIIGKTAIECGQISKKRRSKIFNDIKEKGYAKNIFMKYRAKNNELQCILINTVPIKIKKQVLWLTIGTDISRIKLAKDIHKDDALLKSLDCIEETGVILIGNDDHKQTYLFYMNEVARKALEVKSIPDLLDNLDRNESICISARTGYYHVKAISTHRSSPLKIILMERFPDSKLIKGKMKQQGLTVRQQEIAFWVATGYSNREIAEKFYITEYTVKDHVKKIFQIFNVNNRSELCPKILNLR